MLPNAALFTRNSVSLPFLLSPTPLIVDGHRQTLTARQTHLLMPCCSSFVVNTLRRNGTEQNSPLASLGHSQSHNTSQSSAGEEGLELVNSGIWSTFEEPSECQLSTSHHHVSSMWLIVQCKSNLCYVTGLDWMAAPATMGESECAPLLLLLRLFWCPALR